MRLPAASYALSVPGSAWRDGVSENTSPLTVPLAMTAPAGLVNSTRLTSDVVHPSIRKTCQSDGFEASASTSTEATAGCCWVSSGALLQRSEAVPWRADGPEPRQLRPSDVVAV